jgi:hypothetical protein
MPYVKVPFPTEVLQSYYDEVIPGGITEFREFEEYIIETSELRLPLTNIQTNQPDKRSGTHRQMQLAFL